jgi:hypothetical protein
VHGLEGLQCIVQTESREQRCENVAVVEAGVFRCRRISISSSLATIAASSGGSKCLKVRSPRPVCSLFRLDSCFALWVVVGRQEMEYLVWFVENVPFDPEHPLQPRILRRRIVESWLGDGTSPAIPEPAGGARSTGQPATGLPQHVESETGGDEAI